MKVKTEQEAEALVKAAEQRLATCRAGLECSWCGTMLAWAKVDHEEAKKAKGSP